MEQQLQKHQENVNTQLSTQSTTIIRTADNEITIPFSGNTATKEQTKFFTNTIKSLCGRNKIDDEGTALLTNLICRHSIPNTVLNQIIESLYTTPIYCLADITRLLLGSIPQLHLYTRDEIYRATGQYPSPDYPLCTLPDNTTAHLRKQDAHRHHIPILKDYQEYA